jgi:mannonate dehydratase
MGVEFDRRSLFRAGATVAGTGALTAAGAGLTSQSAASAVSPGRNPNTRPKMVLGTQRRASSAAMLQEFRRHGVERVWGYPPDPPLESGRGYWLASEVAQTKEFIESEPGLQMHAATLPFLGSTLIDEEDRPAIMLGKGPERDRDIDDIHKCLEACAAAGVGLVKYNMSLTGVISTGEVELRGGSTTRQFRAADLDPSLPDTIAGKVSADDFWERIDYFLERVVPVAEEYKVRLACHPQDPGMPAGRGWRGVETVLGSVDGLKRFISIAESPYHGLNFCQGTVSEMLEKPAEQIFDVIRYFGGRRKIFNVHFRNISGGFLNFRETFIDDGDVDMLKAMRVYKEVGYDGMMMPDHVPSIEGDTDRLQGFAFAFGYIKALIAAVAAES